MKHLIALIGTVLLLCSCAKAPLLPEKASTVEKLPEELTIKLDPTVSYHYKGNSWTGWNKFWFASAIAGSTADALTTINALDDGKCSEGNPLLGSNPSSGAVILFKAGAVGLSYWITEYAMKDSPSQVQARNWLYGILTVTGFGAAAWNSAQDCE